MGFDRKRLRPERAFHHRGGLAAYPGQRWSECPVPRHLAAVRSSRLRQSVTLRLGVERPIVSMGFQPPPELDHRVRPVTVANLRVARLTLTSVAAPKHDFDSNGYC